MIHIILDQKCWLKLIIQPTNIYEAKHIKIIRKMIIDFLIIPLFCLLLIINNSKKDKSISAVMIKDTPKKIKAMVFLQ